MSRRFRFSNYFGIQHFLPKYWLYWLLLGLLYLTHRLPYRLLRGLGTLLGTLIGVFPTAWRQITKINIDWCFKEKTKEERDKLVRSNFRSLGITLLEFPLAWWAGSARIETLYRVCGYRHYLRAKRNGHGVILLAPHMGTLEIAGRILHQEIPLSACYKPNKHPLLEQIIKFGRERSGALIPVQHLKQIVKTLRAGGNVLMMPDQDFGAKQRCFAPFFGTLAATSTHIARLSQLGEAQIVPVACYRSQQPPFYRLQFLPPLELHASNKQQQAYALNQLIEQIIMPYPEQYLWQHRRFKTRPPGEPNPYR